MTTHRIIKQNPPISGWMSTNSRIDQLFLPNHNQKKKQAVTKSLDPTARPAIIVPGASHHFWTHPALPSDSPYVVKARLQIAEFVTAALAEPKDDSDSDSQAANPPPAVSFSSTPRDRQGTMVKGSVGKRLAKLRQEIRKAKNADPTNYILDNNRLPGVPLAPFQVPVIE